MQGGLTLFTEGFVCTERRWRVPREEGFVQAGPRKFSGKCQQWTGELVCPRGWGESKDYHGGLQLYRSLRRNPKRGQRVYRHCPQAQRREPYGG